MIVKNLKKNLTEANRVLSMSVLSASTIYLLNELSEIRSTMNADEEHIYSIDIQNMWTNITQIMYQLSSRYFMYSSDVHPAAVIGGVALWNLDEVSHAISELMLKYRATGGIFLAHQEGGEQTLRLQGKVWGLNRYVFLVLMDMLFLYGNSSRFDMFWTKVNESTISRTRASDPMPLTNPWKEYEYRNLDEGIEEKHFTFPVITKTRIYTNMFIETWEFIESVENGMNVINYTIFLRKYVTPLPYKYSKVKYEDENTRYFYADDEEDKIVPELRKLDTMAEIFYTGAMLLYRMNQYILHNSPETNLVYVTNIRLNNDVYGVTGYGEKLQEVYDLDYNLEEFSNEQKAELMGFD